MATLLSGLASVQLSTYDCSVGALCLSQRKRLETDFKLLQDQLQSGVQELKLIASYIGLCDSGMDKSGPFLAPAQPPAVIQDPPPDPPSQVEVSVRPFQAIDRPLGQPAAGWGPLFHDEAPQRGGQDCKQQ